MNFFQNILFKKNGIYILPTKMGGYLNGLIFLLILLSVGYGNNLILIFTLLLFSFNILWLLKSYMYSKELAPYSLTFSEIYANQISNFSITFKNQGLKELGSLRLLTDKGVTDLQIKEQKESSTLGEVRFNKRGVYRWEKILISCNAPFGLYQTFKVTSFEGENFVYPELLKNFSIPDLHKLRQEGEIQIGQKGEDDFKDLERNMGEDLKRVDWKVFARKNEFFSKTRESKSQFYFKRSWPEDFQKFSKEEGLSQLMSEMKYFYDQRYIIEVFINKKRFEIDDNNHLFTLCRKELSLC